MNEPDLQRALELHRSGKFEEAAHTYARLIANRPDHADAWHLSGLIAAIQGNFNEGRRRIERAIELQPRASGFRLNLCRLFRDAKKLDEAIRAGIKIAYTEQSALEHVVPEFWKPYEDWTVD